GEGSAAADAESGDTDASAGADIVSPAERVAARRAEIEAWQARFQGRRFLIPPYKAANLLKERAEYLEARSAPPGARSLPAAAWPARSRPGRRCRPAGGAGGGLRLRARPGAVAAGAA